MLFRTQCLAVVASLLFLQCEYKDKALRTVLANDKQEILKLLTSGEPNDIKDVVAIYAFDDYLLDSIGYVGSTELARDILKVKQERFYHNYSPYLIELENKKYEIDNPELEFYLQYLKWNGEELLKSDKEIDSIIAQVRENKCKGRADIFHLYYMIDVLSNVYYDRNQIQKSLASLYYFLHRLRLSGFETEFIRLKDKALNHLLTIYSKEIELKEYENVMNALYAQISEEYKTSFEGEMLKAYIWENSSDYETNLKSALSKAKTHKEYYSVYFNLGYFYSITDDTLQHVYFKKAIESLGSSSCSRKYFFPAIYGMMKANSQEETAYYTSVLEGTGKCNRKVQDEISFVQFNFIDPTDLNLSDDVQIDTLLSIVGIAEKLFPGKSTLHLQDYYMNMLARLYEVVLNAENNNKYSDALIKEVYRVRLKEKYRKAIFQNAASEEMKINELLKYTNSFRSFIEFDNDYYKELFYAFISENMHRQAEVEDFSINIDRIKQNLISDSVTIVNISKTNDSYFAYILSKDNFEVAKLPASNFDSLSNLLLHEIKDQSNINLTLEKVKAILPREMLEVNTSKIVVIPDGNFSILPLSMLFSNKRLFVFKNIVDYQNRRNSIPIEHENIKIYSYSDKETISDNLTIRSVPELRYGYQECLEIQRILSLHQSVIAGKKFHKEALFKDEQNQLVHVSSHAYSSTFNRLDNYIITRAGSNQNESSKLFGYELRSGKKIPEVVVLSACETGLGKYDSGAGVETLSGTLLEHGAMTVVSTLWKVNEKATMEFMTRFYDSWSNGKTMYDALEETKEAFQVHQQYSHPYFWAGFVLEGNPTVIIEKK